MRYLHLSSSQIASAIARKLITIKVVRVAKAISAAIAFNIVQIMLVVFIFLSFF